MTTLRVGCGSEYGLAALDPKHHKKEPNARTCKQFECCNMDAKCGTLVACNMFPITFCVFRPVGRLWHVAQFSIACRRDDLR